MPFGSSDPRRIAFESVRPTALTAVADVVPVEDGTQIEVQCAYGEDNEPHPGGGYGNAEYTIFVVDRDGNATEIKRWGVRPNRTMTPGGHTDLKVRQIEAVEIRYAPRDLTVLRASSADGADGPRGTNVHVRSRAVRVARTHRRTA